MSAWPGKFVIGLTGNIATGKSVVRKMLEHLGAYGIDADALGHRAIARDAPGYKPVLDTFGKWILGPDGQVDRAKLARVVFADPDALVQLESIVHPLVRQAIDLLIRRSSQKVIVIEAIKLLEGPLRQACDTIWVTYTQKQTQISRLTQKRGLSLAVAHQRINSQPAQEEKVKAADIVIQNEGSFEETWQQVTRAWKVLFPSFDSGIYKPITAPKGVMLVEKARPRHAAEIAALVGQLSNGRNKPTDEDIMAAFGEKAFLFLKIDGAPVGVVGWQVENLVERTDDVYIDPRQPLSDAMQALLKEIESTSRDLQCEIALLFLPPELSAQEDIWTSLGYEMCTIESLGVRAWQEAAQETLGKGESMYFKQLRKDRVLRPV
ncbi:MAG: dephospho-CoA kinase [Anaerolineales bacterium]|nr:dephospho-CoA kinase [Anaerolineae bacterium]PWB49482.1 MAG: dephospho-CoA kinase [Anaerolineales bacterium]